MITLNCIIKIRRTDLKRQGKDDHCSKKIWKAVRTVPEYSLPVDLLETNWIFSLIKAYAAYVFQESFFNYSLYISPASILFNWLLAVKIHVQIISELGISADRNHFGACIFRRRFLPIIVPKVPTVAYTTRPMQFNTIWKDLNSWTVKFVTESCFFAKKLMLKKDWKHTWKCFIRLR